MSRGPRPSRARQWIASVGLVVYGGLVLFVTLLPNPGGDGFETRILNLLSVLYDRGVPEWFNFHLLEFTANILMFVPLGLCIGLLLPKRAQWAGLLILPALSVAIETAQYVFLANRLATVSDVVANSLGGWIGLGIAFLIRAAVHARDRRVLAHARHRERRHGPR